MLSFMDAYALWRCAPLPRSGSNGDLIDTRSDLVLADHYVATVIRFVEKGIFKPAIPDVLGFLEEIMRRVERLCENESAEVRSIALYQHAYAALLHLVYSHYLDMAPGEGGA